MSHLNVEIKARCSNPDGVRQALREKGAECHGIDRQVDTYFNCPSGRLKLREGYIENHLIHYHRPDQAGPKESRVTFFEPPRGSSLKEILVEALGIMTVVSKTREIYFVDNVKFHIDTVEGLGSFVEIEAIDLEGTIGRDRLTEQCTAFIELLGIGEGDLVPESYSDMILRP